MSSRRSPAPLVELVRPAASCSLSPSQVEEEDSQEAKPVATGEWVDPEPRQGNLHRLL